MGALRLPLRQRRRARGNRRQIGRRALPNARDRDPRPRGNLPLFRDTHNPKEPSMSTTKCPKCRLPIPFENTTHDACGWNVAGPDRKPEKTYALCEWNEYGEPCQHRGILSPGTAGGPWYCREHFYKLRGYPDKVRGNEMYDGPKSLSRIQAEADDFCETERLYTVEDKMAYVREKMSGFGKVSPIEHWNRVLATPNLPELSYTMARQALKK